MASDEPRARRRLSGRRRWLLALGLLVVCLAGASYWGLRAKASTAPPLSVPVTRGDLEITVESSGSVEAARSLELPFRSSGEVKEVLVKPGDQVKRGQVLARLDDRALQLDLQQAQADLETAQARLLQAREGSATPEDLEQAEASVRSAQANLQRTRTGNVTAADLASAEAAVRSAEANLQRVKTGNITAADLASAEAAVRSAEARLRAVQNGATPEAISGARTRLEQARQSYEKTRAAASANKSSAEQSMLQAADAVRLAQDAYSRAYWDHQQAEQGINPKSGRRFEEEKLDPEIQKQQYADVLRRAELDLRQAESRLEQAKISYENAKQQEINDIATAQAQVDDAQVQLDELLRGPDETDVVQAQAQLDQARAQLRKLKQGGTAADIVSAQAQLDQARAQLRKLKQGGTAADITSAQAQLDSAEAGMEKLTAPKPESELAIAEAGVTQAQARLDAAKLKFEEATLVAPFDGTIAEVDVVPGALAGTDAVVTLVDTATLELELSLSESDVPSIKVGQKVKLTFDALPETQLEGTVTSVAPTGDNQQGVVTYPVIVQFSPGTALIKVGMTANASITVEQRQGVVQVPSRAIQTMGMQKAVQVLYGQQQTPVMVLVQTGATNGMMTEIISCVETGSQCLREGDMVALNLPSGGSNGGGADGQIITGAPGAQIFINDGGGGGAGPMIREFAVPAPAQTGP